MTRHALVIAWTLVLVSCVQSHDDAVQEVGGESCYTCHTRDYAATVAPAAGGHAANGFPTACANCHRTTGWQPALGLHPDAVDEQLDFSIKDGPHVGIKCLVCHDLESTKPSKNGGNTNCVQCHANTQALQTSHVGAVGAQGQVYAYTPEVPNFCLSCHPNGRAHKHIFPKPHRSADQCNECHDRSAGPDTKGANVSCINSGCHPLDSSGAPSSHREGHTGNRYTTAKGSMMPGPKSFCLQCHATGGTGG